MSSSGRKKIPDRFKKKAFSVCLVSSDTERLEEYCEKKGITKSEFSRGAILKELTVVLKNAEQRNDT